jgi:hypothetical protein
MLIAWMIYAVAITTIIAGCALALDRVAEIWGFSRRMIWFVALTAAMAIPAGLALRPIQPQSSEQVIFSSVRRPQSNAVDVRAPLQTSPVVDVVRQSFLTRVIERFTSRPVWNRLAAVAWLAMSLVLGTTLCRGVVSFWWRRSRWSRSIVDGHAVLLTPDVGPAVVGVIRPRILLPSWALGLEANERALMLQHEAEHLRAKDPMLIAVAASAVALFPWNPAVWLIVKRLRLAIEIDCDRRVLARRAADVHEYGMLLLTVGARSGSALQLGVPLAEPRRFLEHRILAMTNARPSRPLLASVPFAAIALVAAVAAAQTPRPDSTLVVRQATPRVTFTRDHVVTTDQAIAVPPTPPPPPVPLPREAKRGLVPLMKSDVEQANVMTPLPAVRTPPLSIELIRAWIQARHPNVIAGDPHVNAVTIVVDQNNQYLASVADSVNLPGMFTDSVFFRTHGSLQPVSALAKAPLIIVDGVRIDSTAQIDNGQIDHIEVLKGKAAAEAYGPDGAQGVISISSMHPDATELNRLGFAPENIGQMSEFRVRAGVVGPNRMYIAVLQLKKF